MFKPKSKINPRNQGADIGLQLNSLKGKLTKVEVPKAKFNNLTNSERKALHNLKNDENIEIKSVDKSAAAVAWDREDYIIVAEKQLGGEEVYRSF